MQHQGHYQPAQGKLEQGKLEQGELKQGNNEAVTDRRSFLKWAGASTAAAGAQLASGTKEAAAQTAQPKKPALYRESDHVKRYYQLAR
jgi:hypothetical protein